MQTKYNPQRVATTSSEERGKLSSRVVMLKQSVFKRNHEACNEARKV